MCGLQIRKERFISAVNMYSYSHKATSFILLLRLQHFRCVRLESSSTLHWIPKTSAGARIRVLRVPGALFPAQPRNPLQPISPDEVTLFCSISHIGLYEMSVLILQVFTIFTIYTYIYIYIYIYHADISLSGDSHEWSSDQTSGGDLTL